ncbi:MULTISPECIES: tyrosine-protein phosphatase [unclassified Nocardiopsis]|uniref:tyrosine-protein phosphatase n=1 Tax=Nocardiopsis TaxID=2013 RepID=UPI00387B67E4
MTGTLVRVPEGLVNFRDVGGLRTPTATVRAGVLCRSAGPASLTGAGAGVLRDDFALVVDLRAEYEVARDPGVHPATVRLPLLEGSAESLTAVPTLDEVYAGLLDTAGEAFVRIARLVADTGGAVLVHCTAGKDRTGLAVALLLDAVGVEREAVIADYALSESRLGGAWAEGMLASVRGLGLEITPEIEALVVSSPAPVMERVFERLDARYGGAAGYLTAHGLDAEGLERLRGRLLAAA